MNSKTEQRRTSPDDSPESDGVKIPHLKVAGDILSKVQVIEAVSSSLLVGLAELDEAKAKVLVPFVALRLFGSSYHEDSESQVLHDSVLTLENTAFFIAELANGLKQAVDELGELSGGKMRPEPQRLLAMKRLIEDMNKTLGAIDTGLDALVATIDR
ncbi:hypothetical protein [Ensifer sp. Root127]|uniref:hypothetical protein n=1 Tax=Ensifer sp. Root127 TaxID=1736440 RepID=UPI000710CC20|nr:hypothetical protein [Ensifer sp. Root127]KQW72424.1 hypothetical protein ASD03_32255 [Ensifer sp. Root127]